MTISEYMELCLTHPQYGYYIRKSSIGSDGDFTTSPEISQMFGELIGLWVAQFWIDHKKPKRFCLLELGPGKGTLMADLLRATKKVPGFHRALNLILVEISPHLKAQQKKVLSGFSVEWRSEITRLPKEPTIVLANEFFDALPVRQFKKVSHGWQEIMVNLRNSNNVDSSELHFQLVEQNHAPIFHTNRRLPEGATIEIAPSMENIINLLAEHIHRNSGAALIIDYGKEDNIGNTLQAVMKHKYTDPLSYPGESDLTCFVDFEAIKSYAAGWNLIVPNLATQRTFLRALGIEQRAALLSKSLNNEDLYLHRTALDRLTNKDAMGNLFKVLGFRNEKAPPLIGLEV